MARVFALLAVVCIAACLFHYYPSLFGQTVRNYLSRHFTSVLQLAPVIWILLLFADLYLLRLALRLARRLAQREPAR